MGENLGLLERVKPAVPRARATVGVKDVKHDQPLAVDEVQDAETESLDEILPNFNPCVLIFDQGVKTRKAFDRVECLRKEPAECGG